MARSIGKLSARKVETLKEPGRYSDGGNLFLQIMPNGSRSWIFRYEFAGRERMMGLGATHTIRLAEARERARRARVQLLDGVDPLDARNKKKAEAALASAKSMSFEEAARQYHSSHLKKWRNAKAARQILSQLETYAFPVIGRLSVTAIDTGLVLKVVEPIWRRIPETANRVRGRIEKILDWAAVRDLREGDNPARWRGHLSEVLPAASQIQQTRHFRALPHVEVPGFVADLRKREGIGAMALEFTVLTAARTGEVIGAQWSEIDFVTRTWAVPAKRMKAGREHRVPLSDRAVDILEAVPREHGNDFVFIGPSNGSGLSNMGMATVLRRMGHDATVHGFRSTFRDWASETTSFPDTVVEMSLAHAVGNAVERAYRRGDLFDKRRRLMADWARYCSTEQAPGDVVRLRVAR